ncbi:hypothetical protein GCM10009745_74240 [Kribbella yunnanensis]|uniref:DNRLRE domain-containing protein n=1 Tax=Kribbella yunnanensis TaxID=190194 RepID=A0ABN2IZN5_9ACTN
MTQLSRRSVLGLAAAATAAPLALRLPAHAAPATGFDLRTDAWTHVNAGRPDMSYWTAPADDRTARDAVHVGLLQQPWPWRSFVRFPLSAVAGSTIESVGFQARIASKSLLNGRVELWHVADIDPAVALTWNNTNSTATWRTGLGSDPGTGPALSYGSGSLLTAVQEAVARQASHISFGLRNSVENTVNWKTLDRDAVSLLIFTA